MKKNKYIIAIASFLFIAFLTLLGPLGIRANAMSPVENGKWEFKVDKDLPMGGNYFSNTVIVERDNDNYYLTFSILDTSNVSKMSMVKDEGVVGVIERRTGKRIDYTFTILEGDLLKPLTFRCFIVAMQKEKDFNVTIKPDSKAHLSDFIDDLGERPAAFVPKISMNASDSEMNLGSYYQVMPAKATIGNDDIPVEIKAYYISDNERVDVEIINNRFMLDSIGEYHLIYRAESDKYKTSLGNNSYTTIDIKIMSKANATSLAKVERLNGSKVENMNPQANILNSDSDEYQKIATLMSKIADRFEVINVRLYTDDGYEYGKSKQVMLYLKANNTFNRNEIKVYKFFGDELTKVDAESFGRYVRMVTDTGGNYVICVPGVKFVMPMWGYAAITIVGGVALIGAITITIIIVRKRNKNKVGNKEA